MENGRIQNECREEVGRADDRYGKACVKPPVLAPQSAKAEQLEHDADGRENVI